MQYARRVGLRYEHEWENRLRVDAWMQYSDIEPTGALQYKRIGANGATTMVSRFADWQAGVQLRYAPGEPLYNNRLGQESPFNLNKDAPVFRIRARTSLPRKGSGFPPSGISTHGCTLVWSGTGLRCQRCSPRRAI